MEIMKIQNVKGCYDFGPREQKVKNDITRQKENADYLQAFVDDMNALKLASGEYDELVKQKKNMTDTSKVSTYITKAYDTFCESKFGTLILIQYSKVLISIK